MVDILVTFLIILVLFAVIAYIIQHYLPVDPSLKSLIMLVLGVLLLIWLILVLVGSAPVLPLRGRAP